VNRRFIHSLRLPAFFLTCVFAVGISLSAVACVLPVPSVSSSGPLTFCSGQSVTLTSSSGAGYSYKWYRNNNVIGGATNSTYIVTQSGSYEVEVTLDTCEETSNAVVITVNTSPNGTLTADQTICSGTQITLIASGGSDYNWSAPGASFNALTVSPGSTTTYSVTITNSAGCTVTKSSTITVKPQPQATISVAGSPTLCSGQSVNLNASGGAGYTFQWCLNSQPIQGATNQTYTASASGNYQVITMLNGCSRESTPTVITVNPLPVPTITPDQTTCSGDTVTLQATGGTGYQWSGGGPATATYTTAPTSNRTYTVTVTNSFGCTQTATTIITVKPRPNANISLSGSSTLCSGQSVNINASTGTNYSYVWYKNNAVINGQMNATLIVNSSGNYKVVVTLDGCSKTSAQQTITVNPLPTPVVSADATICAGDSITLQASGGTGYQWSSGGPATATYKVAPTSTKNYTVTVTNSFNCTASEDVTITVTQLPQAWISAAGSTVLCSGETLTLSTANTAGYSQQWHRNGAAINNANSSAYMVSLAGNYYVVNTANGCTATSSTIAISVNPLPVVSVSNDTTICSGDTITLHASGGTTYNWNTGFSGADYPVTSTSTRTYIVTISDVNTCAVAKSIIVTTIALPNASVSLSGPSTFCADRTITLTASSGTGYSYEWTKNSQVISGATSNVLVASQTGTYQVEVTANGCSKKSNATGVTVNPLPVASASNDGTICSGDTVEISASGGTSYQWFNGSTNSTISVSPTNTTTYGVTVSNTFGCTASESVIVSTIARPTASITPAGSIAICSGQTTTLTASSGTGYSYQWFEGTSLLNGFTNQVLSPSQSGNYSVIVTANGCPKKSNTVALAVNPLPIVSLSNDTTICSGNSVMLTASGGATYKWSTGSVNQSISASPPTSTTYNVTVTSAQNCASTGSLFVTVIPTPSANITLSGSATICQNDTVTLSASIGAAYFYQWKKDGNDMTGETSSTYHATTAGSYAALVTALGCPKTSTAVNVVVNPLPVAAASNDTTICQGATVDLMAFGGTSYRWSNGRFSQTNSVNPNATAFYSVTVTDANGCTAYEDVNVNVLPLPNANLSSSGNSNLCSGQSVTLTVSSATNYSYQWKKDGFLIGGEINSTYSATQTGAYSAEVTLNGCSKSSNTIQVNVNQSLEATASNDTTICSGDTISLFASGGATYAWSTGETTSNILVAPTSNKTYSVTVSNGTTCTDVETIVVTVKPRPNAFINVSGGATSICEGQVATLNANTGAGLSYQWYKDALAIVGADSAKYLTGDAGSYVVEVTLNGCNRFSSPKEITVNPVPVVFLSNDTTVCSELSITLVVSGGVSYVWNTFATDSVYKITTATTKTYSVTATNSFGCKASDAVTITTLSLPTNVTISTNSSTTICQGKTVTLHVGNTNGTEFQWQNDGNAIPNATESSYDAAENGAYTIFVTGNGCSKTSPAQIVTVKPTPDTPEIIKVGEDSLKCSVAGSNYRWFRDGVTFNVGNQQVKITKSGAYTVYVSENNCPSDTSAPYYFYFTGVEAGTESELSIYPNPNEGKFTLKLPKNISPENTPIQIFNTIGEQVWQIEKNMFSKHSIVIDLSNLPQGVYYLHAEGEVKKVIIAGR